jgi:hypothetical protein
MAVKQNGWQVGVSYFTVDNGRPSSLQQTRRYASPLHHRLKFLGVSHYVDFICRDVRDRNEVT